MSKFTSRKKFPFEVRSEADRTNLIFRLTWLTIFNWIDFPEAWKLSRKKQLADVNNNLSSSVWQKHFSVSRKAQRLANRQTRRDEENACESLKCDCRGTRKQINGFCTRASRWCRAVVNHEEAIKPTAAHNSQVWWMKLIVTNVRLRRVGKFSHFFRTSAGEWWPKWWAGRFHSTYMRPQLFHQLYDSSGFMGRRRSNFFAKNH